MSKMRKDDVVMAIAGNDKGRTGTVLAVKGDKVLVQGLNIKKKHMKGQGQQKGQIIDIEKPVHISNLRVCNADGKPVKLRTRFNSEGERELFYKDGEKDVLYRAVKKARG